MQDIDRKIEARVRGFIAELSSLVRQAALAAVESALTKHASARGASKAAKALDRAVPGRRGAKRKPGEKRTKKELARLTDRLAAYVQSNKGQGIEAIARGLGVETRELTLPVKKLLASKRITSQGQKRATRYFPR
jgi:DNA-binding NtrC family response regulator